MDDLLVRMLVVMRVAILLALFKALIVVPYTVTLHIAALRTD